MGMDARFARVAILIATLMSLGAGYRTKNFVVQARDGQLAKQVGDEAERFRRELAVEWLGHELPDWGRPCPITVQAGPNLGAGGATSFMFQNGRPFGWKMSIQGSPRRILDSVLPHEVTHTIFATHFGRPLPRWADEGACTTVEHEEERSKQEQLLVRFLQTNRGIAFNHMFAMTEYPSDILPLYAQGYSLARYFIAQGGKQKYVEYVGKGMRRGDWATATRQFYGFSDLSDLQVTWLDWVRNGSQPLELDSQEYLVADLDSPATNQPVVGHEPPTDRFDDLVPVPPADDTDIRLASNTRGNVGGWYQRQRDLVRQENMGESESQLGPTHQRENVAMAPGYSAPPSSVSRPQAPQSTGERVIDWGPVSVTAPAVRRRVDFDTYHGVPRSSVPRGALPLSAGGTVWR